MRQSRLIIGNLDLSWNKIYITEHPRCFDFILYLQRAKVRFRKLPDGRIRINARNLVNLVRFYAWQDHELAARLLYAFISYSFGYSTLEYCQEQVATC